MILGEKERLEREAGPAFSQREFVGTQGGLSGWITLGLKKKLGRGWSASGCVCMSVFRCGS